MPRIFFVMLIAAAFGAGLIVSGPAAAQSDPLDCEDYASQADAQAAYREDPTDPADNDADEDGIACELYEFQDPTTDLTPLGEEPDDADDADDADEEADETPAAVGAATGALPTSGTGSALASSLGGSNSAVLLSLVGAAALCGFFALRGVRGRA